MSDLTFYTVEYLPKENKTLLLQASKQMFLSGKRI